MQQVEDVVAAAFDVAFPGSTTEQQQRFLDVLVEHGWSLEPVADASRAMLIDSIRQAQARQPFPQRVPMEEYEALGGAGMPERVLQALWHHSIAAAAVVEAVLAVFKESARIPADGSMDPRVRVNMMIAIVSHICRNQGVDQRGLFVATINNLTAYLPIFEQWIENSKETKQ